MSINVLSCKWGVFIIILSKPPTYKTNDDNSFFNIGQKLQYYFSFYGRVVLSRNWGIFIIIYSKQETYKTNVDNAF